MARDELDGGPLIPEAARLQEMLGQATDPDTPGDALLGILRDPLVAQLRREADEDPYLFTDYPGHHVDLPARREAFLDNLHSSLAVHPHASAELQLTLVRGGAGFGRPGRFGVDIVRNPNAAPEVLDGLARDAHGEQPGLSPAMLAAHPATPAGALDVLAYQGYASEVVLAHPHASAAAREAARFLLGEGEASEATLREIATRGGNRSQLAVARHPATAAGVLEALVEANPRPTPDVLEALAVHPNAAPVVLRAVARALVAEYGQPNSSRLYTGPGPYDPCQQTIRAVRAHPACDETVLALLAQVAALVDLTVPERRRLAADPQTDPAMLTLLGRDVSRPTLTALAANPATPPAVLETLAPGYTRDDFGSYLAANPATPPEVLRRIFQHDVWQLKYGPALLRHPNTPPDVKAFVEARIPGTNRSERPQ